jgi:hypothetical protein
MLLKRIRPVVNRRDSALCVIGIGLKFFFFRYNGHRAQVGYLDGKAEARDAAAENKKISLNFHRKYPSCDHLPVIIPPFEKKAGGDIS